MNNLYLNDYLSALTSQISGSVERLKARESSSRQNTPAFEAGEDVRPRYDELNSLRNYAYNLLDSTVAYQMFEQAGEAAGPTDSSYAAGRYQSAGQVLRRPTVVIDFMFKGNREFDFKV